MAKVLISDQYLEDIADAIREKNNTNNTYTPAQMASAISSISAGGTTPTGSLSIIENGTYNVSNYAEANVNLPIRQIYWNKNDAINPVAGDLFINIGEESVITSTTQSMSFIPNGYLEDHVWADATTKNISSFYANTSSTSYAQVSMKSGAGVETYGYFTFDMSDKPSENYLLTSVSCQVTLSNTATSNERSSAWVALYIGDEMLEGTKVNLTGTSKVTLSIPQTNLTSWEDLANLTLKVSGTRANSNTSYARYFYLYGASLTINYTTTADYQTVIQTERYNGTRWIPGPIDDCMIAGDKFKI